MAFEGLSNTAGGRGAGASDSLRGKKNESPTPIADDVRTQWAETKMRDGDFILTDKDGAELARVPFSDANFNHYMGGPLENAARVEAGQLAILNEQRRALRKPELTSLAQIEEEEKAFRRNRRGPAARDDVPYNNKVRERIQENIRTTFRDLNVGDDVLQQLEQAVGQVSNHASARKLADFIATLPRKPGVAPAGGRPMAQRPKIVSHEGEARHLTPDEIASHARTLTSPAGDDRRGAEYDKKMTPYTAEELAEAKKNLRKTLGRIEADGIDERRANEFNQRIKDSTTPDSIRALATELRGIEDARVKALGKKIDDRRENAPGLYSNGAGTEFIEQNGNLYIREGKAIRLATEKEKTERAARLQAATAAGGPADAPSAAGAGEVVQGTNGTIDLGRLGAQAQENVRSRERPTGPRILPSEPLTEDDLGLDSNLFEPLQHHPTLRGYFMHPNSRKFFSRDEVESIRQRAAARVAAGAQAQPAGPGGRGPAGAGPAQQQERRGWQGILQSQGARPMRNALSFLHPGNPTRSVDGLSMDEILGDKRRATLFNTMLDANGRTELRDRYMEARTNPNAMSDADWAELSRQRYEFTERLKLAEESERLVTREDIAQLMATSPALAFLANSVRPERAAELIKRHTFTMFMQQSEQELAAYLDAQRRLVVIRANPKYQQMQSRVHKLCDQYQISPEQLDSGLVDPNIMKRMFNPGFIAAFSRDVYSKKAHADLSEIDRSIHIFAHVLGMSVSQNQQLLLDTVREAAEGRRAPDIGHDEPTREEAAREEAGIATNFSTERVRAQIREPQFQARVARRYNQQSWANLTPDQREEGTFEEIGSAQNAPRRRSGGGWFGGLLRSLFDALTGNARRDLRAQGAFA